MRVLLPSSTDPAVMNFKMFIINLLYTGTLFWLIFLIVCRNTVPADFFVGTAFRSTKNTRSSFGLPLLLRTSDRRVWSLRVR